MEGQEKKPEENWSKAEDQKTQEQERKKIFMDLFLFGGGSVDLEIPLLEEVDTSETEKTEGNRNPEQQWS